MRRRIAIRDGDVHTAVVAEYEATRREAMRRGIALGGAVLAATSIPMLLRVRNAFAEPEGDPAILEAAVELEQTAVIAYDTVARGRLSDPATARMAALLRDQEQEHADALISSLEELGGTAPRPPAPGDVDGLRDLGSRAGVVGFAIELETMAVAAYHDAHEKLEDAALLRTAASIMANEAQHLVVLRQAIGEDPAPEAFVTGELVG